MALAQGLDAGFAWAVQVLQYLSRFSGSFRALIYHRDIILECRIPEPDVYSAGRPPCLVSGGILACTNKYSLAPCTRRVSNISIWAISSDQCTFFAAQNPFGKYQLCVAVAVAITKVSL